MFSSIQDAACGLSGRSKLIVPWNSSSTSFATSVSPRERNAPDTPGAPSTVVDGAQRLVVANGNEIVEGFAADVGSSFDDLFGGRPLRAQTRARMAFGVPGRLNPCSPSLKPNLKLLG